MNAMAAHYLAPAAVETGYIRRPYGVTRWGQKKERDI